MVDVFELYSDKLLYIHLNGNENPQLKQDKHVQMFDSRNRLKNWRVICEYCANLGGAICIAENTKNHSEWNNWVEFAGTFGFELIEFNNSLSI
jgi:hypothetical protein